MSAGDDPNVIHPAAGRPTGPRSTRRALLRGAFAVGVGVSGTALLAACTSPTSTPSSSAAPVASATAAGPRKPTGSLVAAVPPPITELSLPHFGSVTNTIHWNLFYDYLLKVDPTSGDLAPGLATAYQMSPDAMTWTFNLRDNVPFHKGNGTLTSADVKYSIELIMKNPANAAPRAPVLNARVDHVEAPDDRTVIVKMKRPFPDLGYELAELGIGAMPIISKKYVESVGIDKAATDPVGTGPFEYVSRVQGSSISGRAFDKYWGTPPGAADVTIRYVPEDATRFAMLRNGEADIVSLPRDLMAGAAKDGFQKVSASTGGTVVWMIFGGQFASSQPTFKADEPWLKTDVRRALNLAVNRDEMREKLFGGDGLPAGISVYPPNMAGYQKSWAPRAYDPAMAKKLLADAGYPNGFDMTLWQYAYSGVPEMIPMVEAVASYFRAVGVRTKIEAGESGRFVTLARQYNTAGVVFPMRSSAVTRYDILGLFPTFFIPGPSGQHEWEDPDVAKLATEAIDEVDPAKRAEKVRQIFQRNYDEYRSMPIVSLPITYVTGKKVASWDLQNTYALDLHRVVLK